MNIQDIAQKLVELCKVGNYQEAHDTLYNTDCVSVESGAGMPKSEVSGMEAIAEKGKKWMEDMEEMHSSEVSEPLIAGNSFAVVMTIDMTSKTRGRSQMKELCVYTVADGKIIKEEFIY